MISHTKSYEIFRNQGVEIFNHCVLLAFALPCLESAIGTKKGPVHGILPNPLFFSGKTIKAQELKERINDAPEIVGKELLLSTYSYFEAYIKNVLIEILKFHGGTEGIEKKFSAHLSNSEQLMKGELLEKKRKIQDKFDKRRQDKYRVNNDALKEKGFLLPSQRLSLYGWKALESELYNFKAHKIVSVLTDALCFDLSKENRKEIEDIRTIRNQIAHGKEMKYDVNDAIKQGVFLRDLAVSIDEHVRENFLLIEM